MENFNEKQYYKILDILNNYMSELFTTHRMDDVGCVYDVVSVKNV